MNYETTRISKQALRGDEACLAGGPLLVDRDHGRGFLRRVDLEAVAAAVLGHV
jgi:hypothetical protein